MGKVSLKEFGIVITFGEHRPKCEGKQRLDRRMAEGSVKSLEKKYSVPYDAYPCGDHWHVGHSNKFFTLRDKYATEKKVSPYKRTER